MKTRSIKIEDIRRKFRNKRQWLLIGIDKIDKATTTPLTGRLIAHSPDRWNISKKYISHKGVAMMEYSGPFQKDLVYIFRSYA